MGLKSWLSERLVNSISERKVMNGPFAGLRYTSDSIGSTYPPKILGTYELELRPVIEQIIRQNPSRVIVVGAAEGYYAIGLAQRLPEATVVAYEMREQGRTLISEMAKINGVDSRLIIEAKCEPEALQAILLESRETSWIIMDVEGAELDLLTPDTVPVLANHHILVEIHDHMQPNVGDVIKARFEASHDLEIIHERSRVPEDFPVPIEGKLSIWPEIIINKAMDEKRGVRMRWFVMSPKTSGAETE